MGEMVEARPYFRRAAAVFERLQHPNLPRPYLNLASTCSGTPADADLDSALYYCDRGLVAAERVGDISILAAAYSMKSQVLMAMGQPDAALASLQKAIEVAREVKNLFIETMLKSTLARMMFDQAKRRRRSLWGSDGQRGWGAWKHRRMPRSTSLYTTGMRAGMTRRWRCSN
ncbi:MAG: hypothetical protein IPF41_00020 [Flavobacteriales bacterium]|nr:hypothetical protein [Flavobacteriales bacterium]